MKTYQETINRPRLLIQHAEYTQSPREWSNLGYFLTKDSRYNSPDGTDNPLYEIMLEAEQDANNAEEHMSLMKKMAKKQGITIIAIFPVVKYEHGMVNYKLGIIHGWDYSNNGFYIITKESQEELGISKKDFIKTIEQELEVYNQYANGQVYEFILYNEKGEQEDACTGFYEIDEIKDHLPDEWQNEKMSEYCID